MLRYLLVCLLLVSSAYLHAQNLKGVVLDADSKESIPFAKVLIKDHDINSVADENGRFVLAGSLPEHFSLYVSSIMYEPTTVDVRCCDSIVVYLKPVVHGLAEVLVMVDPRRLNRDNTQSSERLTLRDLEVLSPTDIVDAASQISGVQQVSSGPSSAKPVIRGMQGMRVVTMLNDMRIENQQWGGDHGLGIAQVGIGSIEVMKGPSGLMYAGDGIGGILYLRDEPFAPQNKYTAEFRSRFESVNLGFTNSAQFKLSKKNVRFAIAGMNSTNADYKLPNGKYLSDSRFLDNGAKLSFGANKGNWNIRANYLYSLSFIGIPGHTHDSIATPESFMLDEQDRTKSLPHQKINNHFFNAVNTFNFNPKHSLQVITSHSFNDFYEFEEKIFTPAINLKLNATSLQVKHRWQLASRAVLNSGIQSGYQSNLNAPDAEEILIQDSRQFDNAAYVAFFNNFGTVKFSAAARVDSRDLQTQDFSKRYVTPNGSVGLETSFYAWMKHTVFLNLSSGTRAPHVSELTADGQHHGASRYELGDRNLSPERFTQLDLEYEIKGNHLTFFVNPFYSYVQNFIQLARTDSIIENMPVYQYEAIEQARLYGVDAGFHYHPHFAHRMHLESTYSTVYGESLNAGLLYFMPQPKLQSKIYATLRPKKKLGFTGFMLQHQYYFKQDRVGELETVTDGYHLIQLGGQVKWDLKFPVHVSFGVKNLLGTSYVNHLSRLKPLGLTEPGRSIYINLRINLSGKLKGWKEQVIIIEE